MDRAVELLKKGLGKLLENEKYSDFTIVCGPNTYKVHKVILSAQSEYFSVLFDCGFREDVSNRLELKAIGSGDDDEACDDPDAIKSVIHFLYHLEYQADIAGAPAPDVPRTKDGDMVMHAKVFAAAVKYQIPALRELAASKFAKAVASNWDHNSMAEAVRITYTTTPEDVRDLRDAVASALTVHLKALLDKPDIETVVRSIGGLGYDLLRKSRGMPSVAGMNKVDAVCGKCGHSRTKETWSCTHCGAQAGTCGCVTFKYCKCGCPME